jgi:hypothetical protein
MGRSLLPQDRCNILPQISGENSVVSHTEESSSEEVVVCQ